MMNDVDIVYEKLRDRITRWPVRVPKSQNLTKLLKLIFTPEEAEIMSFFEQPHIDRVSTKKLVKRVLAKTDKFSEDQILEIADNLAKRGMLHRYCKVTSSGKEKIEYYIWPMVIGIFEWFFSKAGMSDGTYSEDKIKTVTKLFEKYAYEGFLLEIGASKYPWARVIPAEQANKVVEVNEDLGIEKPIVLPFEQVKIAIERADGIGVIPCACRTEGKYSTRQGHKACDNPIDVCMILGDIDAFKYAGMLVRELTKEEALELLKKCEKRGLVHCTSNAQEMHFICNCCSCHCGILRGLIEIRNPLAFMKSNYIAKYNENECKKCFRCVEICPTKAITHHMAHESYEEKFTVNPEFCIGCGVCASNCPTKKIDLKKIRNEIPEESVAEAYMRCERERTH
ncbi:MAG: ATP-binding protein [Candidatus Helarchaeota archaeon]